MRTNSILNDYFDDLNEEDDIDGFAEDENDFMNGAIAQNSPDIEPITTISQVSPITPVETRVNQSPLSISISSTPTVESTQSDSISSAQPNSISSAQIQSSNQERAPVEIHQSLPLQALPLNTN
ncbi:unnamed protein product [Brachionus calyciflorus]|uniref:Uncharacterized protein n=1 Tax=Brachionus calyciflorus TaxID=104777 RepID=A0A813ST16_9BILA|nr:unnamed protein product [Brachionus calyciflorus]